MARVTGGDKHRARLRKMRERTPQAVLAALYVAGQKIEIDAEISITSGSISGDGHVPSRPGEPPNADTRQLDTSIDTHIVAQNPPTVHIISNAPYSAALEFGTTKMAARPFMKPATDKNHDAVVSAVVRAVRDIT